MSQDLCHPKIKHGTVTHKRVPMRYNTDVVLSNYAAQLLFTDVPPDIVQIPE